MSNEKKQIIYTYMRFPSGHGILFKGLGEQACDRVEENELLDWCFEHNLHFSDTFSFIVPDDDTRMLFKLRFGI